MRVGVLRITLFLGLAFAARCFFGQEYTYKLFDSRDGLPSSTITALAEDRAGHLWIGTDHGLVRYNGYSFKEFYQESEYPSGTIEDLAVDPQGTIWIATNTGLSVYRKEQFEPVTTGGLDSQSIQRLLVCKDHKVFIATIQHLHVLDLADGNDSIIHNRHNVGGIISLTEGVQGEVWVGTVDDLKKYQNGSITTVLSSTRMAREGIRDLYPINPNLLIGTENDDILQYGLGSDKLDTIRAYGGYYHDFVCFKRWRNELWSVYNWSIIRESSDHDFFLYYPEEWNIKAVKTGLADSEGNLWLGSTEGLIRIRASWFESLDLPGVKSEVYSMMEDSGGSIWLGANHGEIYHWDGSNISEWQSPVEFGGEVIDIIESNTGEMWLASYWQGLIQVTTEAVTRYHESDIAPISPDIYDLEFDQDNRLWIGTYRGVFIKEPHLNGFSSGVSLGIPDHCDVYQIKHSANGMWMAASCGLFNGTKDKIDLIKLPDLPSTVAVRSILVDDPFIWIGTIGFGLRCYRFNDDTLELYSLINEPDRTVLDLARSRNYIWAGTPTSLLRIHKDSSSSYDVYGADHGFFDKGYAYLKFMVDKDDHLFITTSRGIKKVHNVQEQKHEKELIVDRIRVDGQAVSIADHVYNFPSNTKVIELSYYYPELHSTDLISYQWRMTPQSDWTEGSSSRQINLYNPKPGSYQLQLRAKRTNRVLDAKTVSFTINYPWYQNRWIQFGIILLIGYLIYWYVQKRDRSNRLNQELEIQRALTLASLESKALRAQMNPHFLFNILNNLQEMILAGETDLAQSYLTKFSRLMRSILNISTKDYIKIEDEIDFLNLYLELEQIRFDDQLIIEIQSEPDLLTEKIPVFVIQPLVENAIRHGLRPIDKEKHLQIYFSMNDPFITVTVRDNGVGLQTKVKLKVEEREDNIRAIDLIGQRLQILAQRSGLNCRLDIRNNQLGPGTESILYIPLEIPT